MTKNNMDNIHLFLASDNNYAPYIATTLISVLEHTSSFINVYILDSGVSDINKKKINDSIKQYNNFSIEYIAVNSAIFDNLPVREHFTRAMYNRFLIPILKPEIKKAVYSDVDVIFLDDIAKFNSINIEEYGIAAPIAEIMGECNDYKKRFNLPAEHKVFQSGNLLINCEYWRKHDVTNKLIECVNKYHDILLYPDFDALNIFFQCNYKELDYRYSVCTHKKKLKIKPFCIHYSSPDKPWNSKNVHFAKDFWKYAKKTAFYDELRKNYKTIMKNLKNKYNCSFLEKMFSVKNSQDGKHKILTILNIKIIFKKKISNNKYKKKLIIQPNDKCLIIAPHPDDESIACGGLLLKYPNNFDVVVLSDGRFGGTLKSGSKDPEKIIQQRLLELNNAMEYIGIKNYKNLMIPDKTVKKNLNKIKNLNLKQYDYVFIPNQYEEHVDHNCIYKKVKQILKWSSCTKIMLYEVWTPLLNPNYFINITDVIEKKKELINCYPSQLANVDYISKIIGLNQYRGLNNYTKYAEVFTQV